MLLMCRCLFVVAGPDSAAAAVVELRQAAAAAAAARPAPGEPSAGCRRLLAACTRLVGGRKECYSVKAPVADTQIAIVPDRL